MDLYKHVENEVELADFYVGRNSPMEIMKLFYRWLVVGGEFDAAEEVSRLIRKYGGTV